MDYHFILKTLASVTLLFNAVAFSHGALTKPLSRQYHCYKNVGKGPCPGSQNGSVYDWMGVNYCGANQVCDLKNEIFDAMKFCGSNKEKFSWLNDFSANWQPVENLVPGKPHSFEHLVTAPHWGKYAVYLSNVYPPQSWDDMKFLGRFPGGKPGVNKFNVNIPANIEETDHALLVTIWETKTTANEIFLGCSDVSIKK